jgi:formylglycine-generating enzyme required for sulfatase activity
LVKKTGYQPYQRWVKLVDKDLTVRVVLERKDGFVVGKKFRDRLNGGGEGPEMVWIPAGSFQMGGSGDSDEKPVHEVSVDRFAMGQDEVTVGEFRQFVSATGYKTDAEKKGDCWSYKDGWKKVKGANWHNPGFSQNNNHPVVCVSWNDATAYTNWLSQQTRQQYRLPTEAEWEYAARAGTTTKYWWGDKIGSNKANCRNSDSGDSFDYTAPVGSFDANPFGIHDTVGNVWEWVRDWYDSDYYRNSPPHDPNGPSRGTYRVLRGGAWNASASDCRVAVRYHSGPGGRLLSLGFRLLRQP